MRQTTYIERFGDAMQLLCGGSRPTDDDMHEWLKPGTDGFALQDFAATHCPEWAQGIETIDAARSLADTPEEGEGHLAYNA